MSRVFVISQNHNLSGVVSNKQKLWDAILFLLEINEDDLLSNKRSLTVEIYPKWKKNTVADFTTKKTIKINRQSALYPLFKETRNLAIVDTLDEDNAVVIAERLVNEKLVRSKPTID